MKNLTYDNLKSPLVIGIFLIALVYLFSSKVLILGIILYLFSLIFMFRFGKFSVLDLDPVPFCALILIHIFDQYAALYFILISIPTIDLIAGRFNHFSVINFISILLTIFLFGFLPIKIYAIYFGILMFNLIRISINSLLKLGIQSIVFSIVHAMIYMVIGSIIAFFL